MAGYAQGIVEAMMHNKNHTTNNQNLMKRVMAVV